MSQGSCLRTPLHSQRVYKTLLESAQLSSIVSPSPDTLSWKTSPLARSEVLRLFINTLNTDDKHCRYNKENFWQNQFKHNYLKNNCSIFSLSFCYLD